MTDLIERFHTCAEATDVTPGSLFEKAVQIIYETWLNPGDTAVDVGAHRGTHLFPMSKAVGQRGRIYGFEPIPAFFDRLKKRMKQQDIKNIVLRRYALANKSGVTQFNFFENRPAFSGIQRRNTPFDDEEGGLTKLKIKQSTLDKQLPFFKKISAIKLDIEGGEFHALQGAKRILKRSRPLLIFENGRQSSARTYGYSAEDFFHYFDDVGFDIFWLSGEPFQPEDWRLKKRCWEFVALPREDAGFAAQLPDLCRRVLENTG